MDPSRSAITTYRYLRLSVVALPVMLAISVGVEMARGERRLGSISAYYYTPVRSILVGALFAMGLALIAIKARDRNGEDVLLNLAGMLAPVVAVVPAPLRAGQRLAGRPVSCPDHARWCVPSGFVPGIDNNVWPLAVVGVIALGASWWTLRGRGPQPRYARLGLAVAAAVVVGFLGVFTLAHRWFTEGAHYAAAIAMFGALVAVMWSNARHSRRTLTLMTQTYDYRLLYRIVWRAAALSLVLAAGYVALVALSPLTLWVGWVFVVETVLLLLFTVFWVLQTAEFWYDGVPED